MNQLWQNVMRVAAGALEDDFLFLKMRTFNITRLLPYDYTRVYPKVIRSSILYALIQAN